MSNKKNVSPKPEENILATSATSADLEGVNLPVDEEAEAKAAKEAEEAAKAAKIDEAVKAFVSYEAKKAAEANLITRREEVAAMRSQANTARIFETSPMLMRLKELEVIEKVAAKATRRS